MRLVVKEIVTFSYLLDALFPQQVVTDQIPPFHSCLPSFAENPLSLSALTHILFTPSTVGQLSVPSSFILQVASPKLSSLKLSSTKTRTLMHAGMA